MTFKTWSDTDVHFAKRKLSVMEKSTILTNEGKALVMPGAPDTEIEELIAVGFNPALIYGIEEDEQTADNLHLHYWDSSPIYCAEVGYWLSLATSQFSYVHLDYCGQVIKDRLSSIERCIGRLASLARLRISVFGSRRSNLVKGFENEVLDATIFTLLDYIISNYSSRAQEASELYEQFYDLDLQDPSAVVAAVGFVNHVMGLNWHMVSDIISQPARTTNANALSRVRGRHQVHALRRYRYVTDRNLMHTMWIDFVPIAHSQFSSQESWLVDEIIRFVRQLVQEVPQFVVLDDN